eukprot:TRINITY_DN83103_c0_g1_i1.p1 TRINITY_DN83103_c0_g1~~TRINITY_DN83103_c0_g1_i1.p1  ORF type:complete len:1422 (+),score=343.70 TRINITY_DN83103_c0_g1_i1:249-4514(+)
MANQSQWSPQELQAYISTLGFERLQHGVAVASFATDALAAASLPPPWVATRDSGGRLYFANPETATSSWQHPLEAALQSLAHVCSECLTLDQAGRETRIRSLHAEWTKEAESECANWLAAPHESGQQYYYHIVTLETVWTNPAETISAPYRFKLEALGHLYNAAYVAKLWQLTGQAQPKQHRASTAAQGASLAASLPSQPLPRADESVDDTDSPRSSAAASSASTSRSRKDKKDKKDKKAKKERADKLGERSPSAQRLSGDLLGELSQSAAASPASPTSAASDSWSVVDGGTQEKMKSRKSRSERDPQFALMLLPGEQLAAKARKVTRSRSRRATDTPKVSEAYAAELGLQLDQDQTVDRQVWQLLQPVIQLGLPSPWSCGAHDEDGNILYVHAGMELPRPVTEHPMQAFHVELVRTLRQAGSSRGKQQSADTKQLFGSLLRRIKAGRSGLDGFGVWRLETSGCESAGQVFVERTTGRQRSDHPKLAAASQVAVALMGLQAVWEPAIALLDGREPGKLPLGDADIWSVAAQVAEKAMADDTEAEEAKPGVSRSDEQAQQPASEHMVAAEVLQNEASTNQPQQLAASESVAFETDAQAPRPVCEKTDPEASPAKRQEVKQAAAVSDPAPFAPQEPGRPDTSSPGGKKTADAGQSLSPSAGSLEDRAVRAPQVEVSVGADAAVNDTARNAEEAAAAAAAAVEMFEGEVQQLKTERSAWKAERHQLQMQMRQAMTQHASEMSTARQQYESEHAYWQDAVAAKQQELASQKQAFEVLLQEELEEQEEQCLNVLDEELSRLSAERDKQTEEHTRVQAELTHKVDALRAEVCQGRSDAAEMLMHESGVATNELREKVNELEAQAGHLYQQEVAVLRQEQHSIHSEHEQVLRSLQLRNRILQDELLAAAEDAVATPGLHEGDPRLAEERREWLAVEMRTKLEATAEAQKQQEQHELLASELLEAKAATAVAEELAAECQAQEQLERELVISLRSASQEQEEELASSATIQRFLAEEVREALECKDAHQQLEQALKNQPAHAAAMAPQSLPKAAPPQVEAAGKAAKAAAASSSKVYTRAWSSPTQLRVGGERRRQQQWQPAAPVRGGQRRTPASGSHSRDVPAQQFWRRTPCVDELGVEKPPVVAALPEVLTPEKQEALMRVKADGRHLKALSEDMRQDADVVKAAVRSHGLALAYAPEPMRRDRDVVGAAVRAHGLALACAAKELRADPHIVLKAVRSHGLALHHAEKELRSHREIVMAAVESHGLALQYASEELCGDRSLVLAAVKAHPVALIYASQDLQMDPDVLTACASKTSRSRSRSRSATPEAAAIRSRSRRATHASSPRRLAGLPPRRLGGVDPGRRKRPPSRPSSSPALHRGAAAAQFSSSPLGQALSRRGRQLVNQGRGLNSPRQHGCDVDLWGFAAHAM